MNHEDKQRFAAVMAFLYKKFPRPQLYEGMNTKQIVEERKREADDYFLALYGKRIEAIEWAARRYWETTDKPFFPLPQQLKDLTALAPIPEPRARPLLEETPRHIAKQKLQEIFNSLNSDYGTTLKVDQ